MDAQVHPEARLLDVVAACSAGTQVRSRLLSTSACTTSIAGGASGQGARSSTASAASSVKPPSNTEHCANAACSHGASRSHDQSIAARASPGAPPRRARRRAAGSGRAAARRAARARAPAPAPPPARSRAAGRRAAARPRPTAARLRVVEREVRPLRPRARDEQLDRVLLERQRLERQDLLARQVQPLAAGDHEARLGRALEPAADRRRRVLTTCSKLSRMTRQRPRPAIAWPSCTPGSSLPSGTSSATATRRDAVERARLGQVAEPDAAGPVAEPGPAVAAHEARLAGAARAEQRDQPAAAVEPLRERAQLRGAADERVALGRAGCGGPRAPGARGRRRARRDRPCRRPAAARRRQRRARRARRSRPAPRCPSGGSGRGSRSRCRRAASSPSASRAAALSSVCPPRGERHDARGERLGQALDLDRLGAAGDVLGDCSRAASPRRRGCRPARAAPSSASAVVVVERVARPRRPRRRTAGRSRRCDRSRGRGGGRGVARAAIVRGPDLRGARVTEALDQQRAVHDVGEEQGTHGRAKRTPVHGRNVGAAAPRGATNSSRHSAACQSKVREASSVSRATQLRPVRLAR